MTKNQFLNARPAPAANRHFTAEAYEDPSAYPKCKYHPEIGARTVASPEAEAQLGKGWHDSPADFPPVPVAPQGAVEGCPGCEALSARAAEFEGQWAKVMEENRLLLLESAALRDKADKKADKRPPVKESPVKESPVKAE